MNTLFIVATPIGNLGDISFRALTTLFGSDVILCEDTRRTGQLMKYYENKIKLGEWTIKDFPFEKKPQLVSFYDEIEDIKADEIIGLINEGNKIALVSDSGTPLISDPGFKLVRKCIKNNIKIESIPGPSAAITALTLSGMPTNSFLFVGFLPPKQNARIKALDELKTGFSGTKLKPTIICYESPFRIEKTLTDIMEVYGDVEIALARELTKIHEETIRGKISEIMPGLKNIKGEITLLFNPGK